MSSEGILFDSTICLGCRECEAACSRRWRLPYDETIAAQERLSERKLTAVAARGERFLRRLCMHCADPACASACPVSALRKTSAGPVVYEERRCLGCRYCLLACPFHVPVYEWSKPLPRVRKCDMCNDLLASGRPVACAEACPTGATVSGDRDELVQEARRRIAGSPDQYYKHIYGLREVGGTSVLILSAEPIPDFLRVPDGAERPLPERTAWAMEAVPVVAVGGGVLLGAIRWITERRQKVRAAEGLRSGKTEAGGE